MSARVVLGDVLSVLRDYPDNTFDGVLCDPPYGLSFMGKRWDYDVPSSELWAEVLRVCKPGAPLLSSFGTRTYHRGVCRIEDGGWEIRDSIAWMYGSGFPKSLDVSKQGVDGWDGYGTALKPAHEPYVLARKPLEGTVAENVARWGVGALAIDACRVGSETRPVMMRTSTVVAASSMSGTSTGATSSGETTTAGRWPANVILDEAAGAALDAQSGNRPSTPYRENVATGGVLPLKKRSAGGYSDDGGASRFFYCAKASKRERGEGNKHPTVKPLALCEYLARLILPPRPGVLLVPFAGSGSEVIGALRAGWPDVLGIEREAEYVEIASRRLEAA